MVRIAALSALLQVSVLSGLPLYCYCLWHRRRHKRTFAESARRAGLQLGEPRYLLYSLAIALAGNAALLIWSPALEPLVRPGSALRQFAGLGLHGESIAMAVLYGVLQTGFTEELLFRGLIAGSLSRRLPFVWANLAQAVVFLLPHLAALFYAPHAWPLMFLVLAMALIFGWIRVRSGSILGSWLIHASSNLAMALLVAARTAYPAP